MVGIHMGMERFGLQRKGHLLSVCSFRSLWGGARTLKATHGDPAVQ